MFKHKHHKMQALPASFFTLIFVCFVGAIVQIGQFGFSYALYGDKTLSFIDNFKRVHLLQELARSPEDIRTMKGDDIAILLPNPSLKRNEETVVAWHYHGESCALDIYFSTGQLRPDYVEYRALSLNATINNQFSQTDERGLNSYCLKDVLEAQGIDTPSTYARQPTPTWDSPYRS